MLRVSALAYPPEPAPANWVPTSPQPVPKRLGNFLQAKRATEMKHWSAVGDDTTAWYLVIVIACLTMALMFMSSPPSAALTADQINHMDHSHGLLCACERH